MHQGRVINGQILRHHASLGCTENVCTFDVQGFHGFGRILRHVSDSVAFLQILCPVKNVHRVFLRKGLIGGGNGLCRPHNAVNGQARKNHEGLFSAAEHYIVHGHFAR